MCTPHDTTCRSMLENTVEELVAHGGKKGGRSQEPEVSDEMTSQQSVKYIEEKVETICGWWYLHQNTTEHMAGSWYDLNTALRSCPTPTPQCHTPGPVLLRDHLATSAL